MQAAAAGPGIRQQPTAAQLADEQMKAVITTADELTRRLNDLKTAQARIMDFVNNKADLGEDATRRTEFVTQMASISEAANEAYEKLLDTMKKLPERMPATQQMAKLTSFQLECQTETQQPREFYQDAVNIVNRFDSSLHVTSRMANRASSERQSYTNYTYELLKNFGQSHPRARKQLPQRFQERAAPIQHLTLNSNQQKRFEDALRAIFAREGPDYGLLAMGFSPKRYQVRLLEKTVLNALYEVKLVAVDQRQSSSHQPVVYAKALLVVVNGSIDFVQLIAAHEDWRYLDTNAKQVDLSQESRYEVFRKVSHQANIYFQQIQPMYHNLNIPSHDVERQVGQYIQNVLSVLYRVVSSVNQPCFHCKKYLKDFSLPTMGLLDRTGRVYHDTCR